MNNLSIYQKIYDFILYLYPALQQFPKSEKFTFAALIKLNLLTIQKLIIKAVKSKNKLPILFEIDIELEILRTYIRLAKDLKFLSIKKYEISSAYLTEIGKMLGGWIKSINK